MTKASKLSLFLFMLGVFVFDRIEGKFFDFFAIDLKIGFVEKRNFKWIF